MRKTLLSTVAVAGLLGFAGTAAAFEMLDAEALDAVTAGADIEVKSFNSASTWYEVFTDADHDVEVTESNYAGAVSYVSADDYAIGGGYAESNLSIEVKNN